MGTRRKAMTRPSQFWPAPSAAALRESFVGLRLSEIPTPAVILDRARIAANSAAMLTVAEQHWQCLFRAHIKTHKTREATAAQVARSRDRAIIVSTFAEAWGVIDSGLVRDGTVVDILYGVPLGMDKVEAFLTLRRAAQAENSSCNIKTIVDHPDQIIALRQALEAESATHNTAPLQVFIKIDCGYNRAGQLPHSSVLTDLVDSILASPNLYIHGVYCHAGFSYDCSNIAETRTYFSNELKSANEGAIHVAEHAQSKGANENRIRTPLVMSIGSTPTAHAAASLLQPQEIEMIKRDLKGELELHAGNYPFLDLQQLATSSLPDLAKPSIDHCAMTVLTSVLSVYPGRKAVATSQEATSKRTDTTLAAFGDEALCDAGGIAMSKDVGRWPGHGHVVSPVRFAGWHLARISQEHGVLGLYKDGLPEVARAHAPGETRQLTVGTRLQVIPQHACMVAAAHPWFFIVDSSLDEHETTVQDIWVPWKGW